MQPPLFRPEVLTAQRSAWYGNVVLLRPLSFALLTAFAALSTALLLAFLFGAHYTKRVQVGGLLVPDAGLVRIQSPQPGLIVERHVREGQQVRAGEVLYVVSSELQMAPAPGRDAQTESQGAILHTLRARQDSVAEERVQAGRIAARQAEQLTRAGAGLGAEIAQLDQEIATQSARLKSAQSQYQRNVQMQAQGFISSLALQQKNDELLDQQGRLQSAQRSRLGLLRELGNTQSELAALAGKSAREQTQLGRQVLELEQQSLSTQARRRFLVTAPQAGTVTAILAEPGHSAGNQTLLTILPAGAVLEAQLYVPSRAVGFIEAGQKVSIRYAAFPYQKFGQHEGRVTEVSRSALLAQDMPAQLVASEIGAAREGMYRVRVALARQSISSYGKAQALSAGMQLDADVLQDRRSLLEWLLEPVYSLKGKV
ncbi:membrane fusion protein [Janthinobacterium sp. CG_23.3]|uniref:HlyD family secretion protein n=1 Tax=Janthinobacterium sp. CG_23.3 TaxID=3349634 RepID=UPI0038D3BDDC